jgi:hypothetical protein
VRGLGRRQLASVGSVALSEPEPGIVRVVVLETRRPLSLSSNLACTTGRHIGLYVEQPRRLNVAIRSDAEEPAAVRDLTNVHVEEVASGGHRAPSTKSNNRSDHRQSEGSAGHQNMSIRRQLGRFQVRKAAARADSSPQAAAIDATLGRSHRGAHEARHRAD